MSPLYIEQKDIKIETDEREKIYYGLTLRGLHYLYDKELIKTEQIQKIIKSNLVRIPECNEEQFNLLLKDQRRFGLNDILKALLVELYPRHKQIAEFMLSKFPDIFFKPDDLFPLFRVDTSDRLYGLAVFIKAVMELISNLMDKEELTDNEAILILGETGFELYQLLCNQIDESEEKTNTQIQQILRRKKN